MEKPIKRWVGGLTFLTLLESGLLATCVASGPYDRDNGSFDLTTLLISLSALAALAASCFYWYRFLRGKTVLRLAKTICLNGGEITLDIPQCAKEIWIFSDSSFAQYYGNIIVWDSRENCVIDIVVRRKSPLFYPVRSDLKPIIRKTPGLGISGFFRIEFRLVQTFKESIYEHRSNPRGEGNFAVILKNA